MCRHLYLSRLRQKNTKYPNAQGSPSARVKFSFLLTQRVNSHCIVHCFFCLSCTALWRLESDVLDGVTLLQHASFLWVMICFVSLHEQKHVELFIGRWVQYSMRQHATKHLLYIYSWTNDSFIGIHFMSCNEQQLVMLDIWWRKDTIWPCVIVSKGHYGILTYGSNITNP